jgi:neutral ceramidase
MANRFKAGACALNITPSDSMHLFGYPHVERFSTGVHDPLWASALYLSDAKTGVLFLSCDMIFVPKDMVNRARRRIEASTGVEPAKVVIAATHTHSGPDTVAYLSNEADPTLPPLDPGYLRQLEDGIVQAAEQAVASARPAEIGMTQADGSCVGTNRRNPDGPSDPEVPIVVAREVLTGKAIGMMLVCAMHPTVLHEDSTLISGDFPGLLRQHLQRNVLGDTCPVLYFMGASGNQSPRHVTKGNTFDEAKRLGEALGKAVANAHKSCAYSEEHTFQVSGSCIDLPLRTFPSVEEATRKRAEAEERFDALQSNGAPAPEVRTAECDLFGAQETVTLAQAAENGRLADAAAACLPAEIQVIHVGPWRFAAWQGEVFVEFALAIKRQYPDTHIITVANGELQGYLVTEEALREGGYEASNTLFQSPESGDKLVAETARLLDEAAS